MTTTDYIYYRKLRDELRRAILELTANPATSTSISTGSGSKSVTYQSISALQSQLTLAEAKCEAYERANGGGSAVGFETVPVRWC